MDIVQMSPEEIKEAEIEIIDFCVNADLPYKRTAKGIEIQIPMFRRHKNYPKKK